MEFQENSHRGRIFENVTSILQKKTERVNFASGRCFFGNKFFSFYGNKIIYFYNNLASLLDFRESHA